MFEFQERGHPLLPHGFFHLKPLNEAKPNKSANAMELG